MSSYGLKINNPDGTSFIFNENTTIPKMMGSGYYGGGTAAKTIATGIYIPEGYNFYLWVNPGGWIDYKVSGSQWTPTGAFYHQGVLDGNRQVIIQSSWSQVLANWWAVFAYPVATKGSYGLSLNGNGSAMFRISDVSTFTKVAWKGDITISSGWKPSSIGNFDFNTTMIFFYTTDINISVCKDGPSQSYKLYKNGGGEYSGSITVKMVVFSNGIMNRGKYGLRIYSPQNGSLVYDSSNQILVNPQLVTFPQTLYSLISVPSISRPMYLPSSIGGFFSNQYMVDVAVVSNGYQVAAGWGTGNKQSASHGGNILSVSPNAVICIDAQDYFNF